MWVVDPIDGTANFARGVGHFCVSIACVLEGRIEVGVIYDPMQDELFSARRGGGAFAQRSADQALRGDVARQCDRRGRMEHAGGRMRNIWTSFAASPLWGAAPFRTGSGALGIAYVAAGRRDGFIEHHINAWDCLAAILLVQEAGGYVSQFLAGEGLAKGNPIIACAPGMKDALVSAVEFEGIVL